MENLSNRSFDGELRTREMVYEKFKAIYTMALDLEKETMEALGDDHPITEEISLVCTHIMNGDIGIEDSLYLDVRGCNHLELETLEQAFQVLESIRWSGAKNRAEIRSACSAGAKMTADSYGIERNTVADIWIRRLGLEKKTEGFLDLVEEWMNGDTSGLKRVLKSHTHPSMHALIDGFFEKKGTLH
jgi:hypothetical protein